MRREIQCKECFGGHALICPECKASTLVTGPPGPVDCPCGAKLYATWWRYGDPIIKIPST